jgi:hypothetical protein
MNVTGIPQNILSKLNIFNKIKSPVGNIQSLSGQILESPKGPKMTSLITAVIPVERSETPTSFLNSIQNSNISGGMKIVLKNWNTKPIENEVKLNSKIVHPLFLECTKLVTDEFWINVLENCAKGKFKKGFSYKLGYLYFKSKEKIYIDSDPCKALNQIQYFMKTKAGIMSESDRLINNQMLQDKISKNSTMSESKNNKNRNMLFNNYISKVANYYNLNNAELLQLRSLIFYALILEQLNDTNVIYENRSIVKIEGLNFDSETRFFTLNNNVLIKKSTTASKSKKTTKTAKSLKNDDTIINKFSVNKSFTELLNYFGKKKMNKITENDKMESIMYSSRVDSSNHSYTREAS